MSYDPRKHKERIGIEDNQTGYWITVDLDSDGEVRFIDARDKANTVIVTTDRQRAAMLELAKTVLGRRT